ncbi:MAG: RecQ family ATP-dependent DNA helicase [Pseudomonadota bacterium]
MPAPALFLDSLFLDLEVTRDGRVMEVGAVRGEATLRLTRPRAVDWERLDRFAAGADLIVGHNVLEHDLPHLARAAPGLALLTVPAVDTLVLSPLCFPRRPYHALVKEHRLVKDAANDPVADGRLCARLFEDEKAAIAALGTAHPLPRCWLHALDALSEDQPWAGGFARLLEQLGVPPDPPWDVYDDLFRALTPTACAEALARLRREIAPGLAVPLAYAASWLLQADPGSVLPTWVRRRHPAVAALLQDLRERPCGRDDCPWCPRWQHPETLLARFTPHTSFRPEPRDPDTGGSLQRAIVLAGLSAEPLFAVLPTGGGKSLCFQVPARARHQRLGLLTVVISPLQSLMKDQVDGLAATSGGGEVAALHGMVTAPERTRALAQVADGTCGLLYVSPEQLRNRSVRRALLQRQIGAWVFDEAHCLSAWGHDFRTDYLYAPRFIRELAEEQGLPVPPVACFTATSQRAVTEEIRALFQVELGQELRPLVAGIERPNLHFSVEAVTEHEKLGRILEILEEHLAGKPGVAIVFNATRRKSVEQAAALAAAGWSAAPFHAGLDPNAKRDIQDRFLGGGIRVICATSAFGMGIDKPDVRLVIHAETPGSLESYLQQAGRAGRDRADAHCVLLACDRDLETQFSLWARGRLSRDEIASVLRAVRRARRGEGPVVLTAGELLRMEETAASLDPDDSMGPTKVATAVYWLERRGFLLRDQNVTHLFQGRPKVASLAEAEARMPADLTPEARRRWLVFLGQLMNAPADAGLDADDLAALAGAGERGTHSPLEAGLRVLRTLRQMSQCGLVSDGLRVSAFLRHKVADPSSARLTAAIALEESLIARMQTEDSFAEEGGWGEANLHALNQHLLDEGSASSPETVKQVLGALRDDRDPENPADGGSLELSDASRGRLRVRQRRSWEALKEAAARRHQVAETILTFLTGRLPPSAPPSSEALVEFGMDELLDVFRLNWVVAARLRDLEAAVQRALLYLHDFKVITLQNGLAVFRKAMTLALEPGAHGRRYTRRDYEDLRRHYEQRVIQIHVMGAYARIGAENMRRAMRYAQEWFDRDRQAFLRAWFPDDAEMLGRATSQRSWQRIVEELRDRDQQQVVTEKAGANLLVLAGPGAGKTRTLVHRCAWLVRVRRAPASSTLVLCYNRSTAHELRRRLRDLLEDDARGVTVSTLHGLALRITGRSLADARRSPEADEALFDAILDEAADLLEGKRGVCGLEPDELRERLLAGYRHILVDEYQDMDARQYRLIAAIAGRGAGASGQELPLSLFAVGDDDQNIYAFRGASTAYIRKFEADYSARVRYLVSNYRATARIIQASQALIAHAPERMKREQTLRVDPARRRDPPGGRFERRDPLARGRVQRVLAPSAAAEAAFVLAEMQRLRALEPGAGWDGMAVFARTRRDLGPLRALLEREGVPCRWEVSGGVALHRVREPALLLEALAEEGPKPLTVAAVAALVERLADGHAHETSPNPWWELCRHQVAAWAEELGDSPRTAADLRRDLWEVLAEHGHRQHFGHGVLLATLHAAKGLEYPHVFLLDCGRPPAPEERDAERRLLYVGMTRARQTLCLCARGPTRGSLLDEVDDPELLPRAAPPVPAVEEPSAYEILGLGDLFLDWAGRHAPGHPVHAGLAALEVGDALTLAPEGEGIALLDRGGRPVARLAQQAAARWLPRLERVQAAQVIAVVRREAAQVQPEFAGKLRAERWELPIVEVRLGA